MDSSPELSARSSSSSDLPDLGAFDGVGESSRKAGKRKAVAKAMKPLSQKKPVPKTRFTSNRAKAKREVRTPGGSAGKSFIKVYEYEGECAAYCGFDDVAEFRKFALSPYIIHHYNILQPVLHLARRSNALQLLYDIKEFEKFWISEKTPEELYPVEQHAMNAHYQMAYVAVKIVMSVSKALFTQQEAQSARATYQTLTGRELPTPPDVKTLKLPNFGPFESETSVEPYNRALNALLYVQFSNNKSNWKNRFGNINWASSKKIRETDKPDWMRHQDGPQDSVDGLADEPLTHTAQDDNHRPIEVQVVWQHQAEEEPQQEYIHFAKQEHKALFVMGKPKKWKLSVMLDPRMTVEMFRDSVRVAFDMPNTDAQILEIWQDADDVVMLGDVDWETLKGGLLDESSKALFNVIIRKRELHESIFEYEGPPLLLVSHLRRKDGDVHTVANVSRETREQVQAALATIASSSRHVRFNPLSYFKGDKTRMISFYDGFDVSTKEGTRAWQQKFFHKIAGQQKMLQIDKKVDNFAKSKFTKVRPDEAQAAAMIAARDQGEQTALDMDAAETTMNEEDQLRYYTYQASSSGTSAQVGPPLNLSITALEMERTVDGRGREVYKMKRFTNAQVKRTLHPWQVNGTAFVLPRLLGYLPVRHNAPPAVRHAAHRLRALRTRCAFIKDETGSGKSIFLLACLQYARDHIELDNDGERIFHMKFLAVPQTLLRQWATEIIDKWPAFDLIISYDDGALPLRFAKHVVSSTAVKSFPSKQHWPKAYQYVMDPKNPRTGTTIWLTTYETHVERTLKLVKEVIPHDIAPEDEGDWNIDEIGAPEEVKTVDTYVSNMAGVFDVVAGDEGHKWKRLYTKRWWSAFTLRAHSFVFMSATPTINTQFDLLGPLGLVWPCIEHELKDHEEARSWVLDSCGSTLTFEAVDDFDKLDPRRLSLLSPSTWKALLDTEDLAVISVCAPKIDALVSISRSRASKIPRDPEGTEYFDMREGTKEHFIRTRHCERKAEEEQEFQWLHREAARRFVKASKKNKDNPSEALFAPSQGSPEKFVYGVAEMRELCIITGSTVAAAFNTIVTQLKQNTLVDSLDRWRTEKFDAFSLTRFICRATGTHVPTKASEYLSFLCRGSPMLRGMLKHIADGFLTDSNGKLIIAEEIPMLAWFYALVLNMGLWDTEVFHAGLSGSERDDLVSAFNTKGKGPKGLIMHFDVGCLGLNMDGDCHEIIVCTPAKNHGTEVQMYGRVIRNTQELIVLITKLFVENSICGYRESKKTDKYIVELATRAQDPDLRRLMVALLNEYQEKVNEMHADPENAALLIQLEEKDKMESALQDLAEDDAIVPEEPIQPPDNFPELHGKRLPKPRQFYHNEVYDEDGKLIGTTQDHGTDSDGEVSNKRTSDDKLTTAKNDHFDDSTFEVSTEDESDDNTESEVEWEEEEEDDADFEPEETDQSSEDSEAVKEIDKEVVSKQALKKAERKAARKLMASENQMTERVRQLNRLLRLPPNKIYSETDLKDEATLRRALQLVHCGRLGINPDDVPSPHVKYSHFSTASDDLMKGSLNVEKHTRKFLGFLLGGGKEKNWKGKVPEKKNKPENSGNRSSPESTTPALTVEQTSAIGASQPGTSPPSSSTQSLEELKQICRSRNVSTKGFGNNKSKYTAALRNQDHIEWRRNLPPLHQSLLNSDMSKIISKGHNTEPDDGSAVSYFDKRKALYTQLMRLEHEMDYPKLDTEALEEKMFERGLDVPKSAEENRVKTMHTRLRFADLQRILANCDFDEWPLTYLKAEAALMGIVADLDNHDKLCLAMSRQEQEHVYPRQWKGLFQYPAKAPLSYIRGLLDKAGVIVPQKDLNNRMAMLDLLREYGASTEPTLEEPLNYAEKVFGISAGGDPWRKIHNAKTDTGKGQLSSKRQKQKA